MSGLLRKLLRAVADRDPSFCDMREDAHSRAAAREYHGPIVRHLTERLGPGPLRILDAGCQAGRLLIPLAQAGHDVTGIDRSGFALRRARRHAAREGLRVRLRRGDIGQVLARVPPGGFDAVICTEVLYLCRDHRDLLVQLSRSVRPGGLLCVSHRAHVYYLANALMRGQPALAEELTRRAEGPSPDGDYHNWHSPEQLRALYGGLGMEVLELGPVDFFERPVPSGLRHDVEPWLAGYLTPSGYRVPAYWLVIAQRPKRS